MPSLLDIPPELRLLIYEAILATPLHEQTIKDTVLLAPNGRPQLHPLARACHTTCGEFAKLYVERSLANAKFIDAQVRDFQFEKMHYILDLPPLRASSSTRPSSAIRTLAINLVITNPRMLPRSRASLDSWYKHCEATDLVKLRRDYHVRFSSKGSLAFGDLQEIKSRRYESESRPLGNALKEAELRVNRRWRYGRGTNNQSTQLEEV
ncbi:hypothetical protein LTR17_000413 [Elasticomyces elasticus]|nr:hypothetical protein LTR17_000413 [Elasticomyces elasticus]